MKGLKLKYKGKDPISTQKLNRKLFGSLHKYKGNCMNYLPGTLHDISYTKIYNSCYFIPTTPEIIEALKDLIKDSIEEFCFDLSVEEFELPEDEHFFKYVFKTGYKYWKDYTVDLGRIFKCKAKYRPLTETKE